MAPTWIDLSKDMEKKDNPEATINEVRRASGDKY